MDGIGSHAWGELVLSPSACPVRLQDETIILEKEKTMKYAMLIYPKSGSEEALGEDERNVGVRRVPGAP